MTHRKISVALLAGAAILSLSACGGSFDSAQCKDQSYYDANKEQCLTYARSLAAKELAKEAQTPVNPPAPSTTTSTAAPVAPAAPAAPSAAKVGETVQFDGGVTKGALTLNEVRRITEPENPYTGVKPKSGSWLLVDVTAKVTERNEPGGLLISYLSFTLQDASGMVHQPDPMAVRSGLSQEVTPGRTVRGQVAFDVPNGTYLLDWAPGLGAPAATWTITN